MVGAGSGHYVKGHVEGDQQGARGEKHCGAMFDRRWPTAGWLTALHRCHHTRAPRFTITGFEQFRWYTPCGI